MPTLRSREITFTSPFRKTLEKEDEEDTMEKEEKTPTDPLSPFISDAAATKPLSLLTISVDSPRRRSLLPASASTSASTSTPAPAEEKVSNRRRAARVSVETGSMNLRSGTSIVRRVLINPNEMEEMVDATKVDRVFEDEELFSVAWPEKTLDFESIQGEEIEEKSEDNDAKEGNQGFEAVGDVTEKANDRVNLQLDGEGSRSPSVRKHKEVAKRSTRMNLRSGAKRDKKGKEKIEVKEQAAREEEVADLMVPDSEEEKGKEAMVEPANEMGEGSRRQGQVKPPIARKNVGPIRRARDKNLAMSLAPKYAFYKADKDTDSSDDNDEEEDQEKEGMAEEGDWPGPFSTAMKLIGERAEKLKERESRKDEVATEVKIQWVPSNSRKGKSLTKSVPSLCDLCLKVICQNIEEIVSLDGVPDMLRHRISSMLCRSRKINLHILNLMVSGAPTEIRLSDCSWVTEEQFLGALHELKADNLQVVQLDLCGRSLSDYVLRNTLARAPNNLPLLTSISLKGHYCLSDDGLHALAASAPSLSSINLSQCSLITSAGIIGLAEKLETVLRELYIDHCLNVVPMMILHALINLKSLEVLSVSGIETVSDKFVKKLISARGSNFKELGLAGCRKLTAASVKVIGENCSQLCALDLCNLNRLTDPAIGHLGNGCRSIEKLKLHRNKFSDEAVAAFVEVAGGSLNELSLNNVPKVAQHTATAISRHCSALKSLDLSFCREITDEAFGLIADNCSNLRILKLFGCTQVTNLFLEGHSNHLLKVVGLEGSILD